MKPSVWALLVGALVAGIVCGLLVFREGRDAALLLHEPRGVMGTEARLVTLADRLSAEEAGAAMQAGEAALRLVEARVSSWIDESPIGRFNAGDATVRIAIDATLADLLAAARAAHAASDGAFDICCKPLISLWKAAGVDQRLPDDAAIAAARDASRMDQLIVADGQLGKAQASTRLDFGGIAKGYAIDQAIAALQQAGLTNALVDVGGDLRCIGAYQGDGWPVVLRSPWGGPALGEIRLQDKAVCTSGNYARYSEIAGRRFSHIIDPRSGWPIDSQPSVTVIADDCMTADIWATALSVLGEAGLERLPAGVEALLIIGNEADHRRVETPGFGAYLAP